MNAYLAIDIFFLVHTAPQSKEEKNEKLFLILECSGKRGLHMCSRKLWRVGIAQRVKAEQLLNKTSMLGGVLLLCN